MITKERLEELVKQGATIYDIFKGDIYFVNLTMAKYYDVPKYIEYKNDYYNCNLTRSIQDLFETKEEAEWYLEFGNITRTETLKLPTWEYWQKVSKYGMYAMSFFDKENHYCELQILETIKVVKWGYGRTVEFENSATKENYIEACELCKKLFLGEEV